MDAVVIWVAVFAVLVAVAAAVSVAIYTVWKWCERAKEDE